MSPLVVRRYLVENGIPPEIPKFIPRIFSLLTQENMLILAKPRLPTSPTVLPPASFISPLVKKRLKFVQSELWRAVDLVAEPEHEAGLEDGDDDHRPPRCHQPAQAELEPEEEHEKDDA